MSNLTNQNNQIYLSAESFIKALQGKTVLDENGTRHNFLYTRYKVDRINYRDIVVIDKRVIVKEDISIKKDESCSEEFVFRHPIIINGGDFHSSFSIYGGDFHSYFRIYEGNFHSSFRIYGGNFHSYFRIYGGDYHFGFRIQKGDFHSFFFISGGNFHYPFRIYDGNFHTFFISGGNFHSYFRIYGGDFQDGFTIFGGKFYKDFTIIKASIPHLQILRLIHSKFTVKEGIKINQITLKEGINSEGALYIDPINLYQLKFKNFINEGKLEVTGLKPSVLGSPQTQISLLKSNLGNAVFKGVAFDEFDQIIIDDSKVNNISTINKHFPLNAENLGNEVDDEGKLKHDPKQMAEIYNQLYLAMQKQGNRLKEMGYYSQYLYWQRKAALEEKKWPALISLTLYQWSTNFGQSWVKGIGISLLLGLIFYFLYSISLKGVNVSFQHLTLDNLLFHGKYYFQFLLPTHKLDFIPYTQSRFLSSFLDIFSRIALGYMYYQTITAFRRFGRK